MNTINTGRQSLIYHILRIAKVTCAHCSLAVLCASSKEGVAPVSGLDYRINSGYFLAWCISLSWLLIATRILLCQGQGA
jgi:hypothetical protein